MEPNHAATSDIAPREDARSTSPQKCSSTKAAAAVSSPVHDAEAAASAERLARRREAQRHAAHLPRPVPNVASGGSPRGDLLRPQGALAPLRSTASQLSVPRPSSLRLSPLRSSQPSVPKLSLFAHSASRHLSPDSDGSDDDSNSDDGNSVSSARSSTLSARSRLTHARIFARGVEEAAARNGSSSGSDYRFAGFGGSGPSQGQQQPSASGNRRTDRRSTQVCVLMTASLPLLSCRMCYQRNVYSRRNALCFSFGSAKFILDYVMHVTRGYGNFSNGEFQKGPKSFSHPEAF